MVVSIFLFSNQQLYLGVVPAAVPAMGDLTFEVGFVLAVGAVRGAAAGTAPAAAAAVA